MKKLLPLAAAAVLIHIVLTWIRAIQRGKQARLRIQNKPLATRQADQHPGVSILVPAWREQGTIERCIMSLQQIDYPSWEVLILAGGDDGTLEAAQEATAGDDHFRVVRRGPEPKNVALMQGIQVASHDLLVILDADSIVEPDWLTELAKPIVAGATASFGMHYPARETWISLAEQMHFMSVYSVQGNKLGAGCSSLAIRKDAFDRIGSLPPNAFSFEDWDIMVRLIDGNEEIGFAPKARLITDRPFTLSGYWTATLRSYRSHLAAAWCHRELLIRRPLWAFLDLFFLIYGTAVSVFGLFLLALFVMNPPLLLLTLPWIVLFGLWLFGRRASQGAELMALTGEQRWLGLAWAPALLLPIQFVAAMVAIFTFWKQPQFDYKGPRTARTE